MRKIFLLMLVSCSTPPARAPVVSASPDAVIEEDDSTSEAETAEPVQPDDPLIALGREHTEHFYEGKHSEIILHLTQGMRSLTGSDLYGMMKEVEALGGETEVMEERVTGEKGNRRYTRTAKFEDGTVLDIIWVFDADNQINGFMLEQREQEAEPSSEP